MVGGSDQVDSSEIMDLNKISEDKVIKLGQQLISKFLCPVTNKIMKDPVIGSNGITFDRNSIENENFNKILNLKNENLISNKSLKELIEFSINEGLIDILKTKEYFNEKYIDLLNNIKNNFDTIPDIFKKKTINFIKIDYNGNILINFNNESNILINTNNNVSRDDEKSSKILDKTEEIIDDFSKKLNKSKYNKYDKSSRRGYNISKVKAYDINSSIERLEYF